MNESIRDNLPAQSLGATIEDGVDYSEFDSSPSSDSEEVENEEDDDSMVNDRIERTNNVEYEGMNTLASDYDTDTDNEREISDEVQDVMKDVVELVVANLESKHLIQSLSVY